MRWLEVGVAKPKAEDVKNDSGQTPGKQCDRSAS
jgi:hypothetical protein